MSTPVAAVLTLGVVALITAVLLVDSVWVGLVALVVGIALVRMGPGRQDEPEDPAAPARDPRAGRRRSRRR